MKPVKRSERIVGIVLAGGRATRLGGGDKGLHEIGGRPILDRVVATMAVQCQDLILNANGDPARFARLGLPVVVDDLADHPGPLAGVLSGLDWAARHVPDASFAVTAPTDTPFLPKDLAERLLLARDAQPGQSAAIVCARSGGSVHYVAALWAIALRHDLRACMAAGERKVSRFLDRHAAAYADWPIEPRDPFFNVNTDVDLREAEAMAARGEATAREDR